MKNRAEQLRPWLRPLAILTFGFLFSKLVCLACGVILGELARATSAVISIWFVSEIPLNVWELPPFVSLACLDRWATGFRAPVRLGVRLGAWAGLLAPELFVNCWVWVAIFRDGANGSVFLVFTVLPGIAAVSVLCCAALGGLLGSDA